MSAELTTRIQVRFNDFDPNGHVNNVAYFSFMEIGRMAFVVQLRSVDRMSSTIIAHADIDYLREITRRAPFIDVKVTVEKIGTKSFVLLHEISDAKGVAARGHAVLVAVTAEGATRELTEMERDVLTEYLPNDQLESEASAKERAAR